MLLKYNYSRSIFFCWKEIEDLVLINIDNGDITHSKMAEEEPEIPDVPAQAAETFIKRWKDVEIVFVLVYQSCLKP